MTVIKRLSRLLNRPASLNVRWKSSWERGWRARYLLSSWKDVDLSYLQRKPFVALKMVSLKLF